MLGLYSMRNTKHKVSFTQCVIFIVALSCEYQHMPYNFLLSQDGYSGKG